MKKLNKNGLTLVELIVSLALLSIILIFLLNLYLVVKKNYNNSYSNNQFELIKSKLILYINGDASNYGLTRITKKNNNTVELTFLNDDGNILKKELTYNSAKKSFIYTCSTCSNVAKLSNTNLKLPSEYTFSSLTVNDINSVSIITINGVLNGKNKKLPVFLRKVKSEYSSGEETLVNVIKKIVEGEPDNKTDEITKPSPDASCTNTLAYDNTPNDNNLRYVGKNPCNYVKFNNELWRIIGVMNHVNDGNENKETRIKLIRKNSLGQYSWDTSSSTINYGYGINEWPQADLRKELNGDYLDTTLTSNKSWYNGRNNAKTGTFSYANVLNQTSQNLISNARFSLSVSIPNFDYMHAKAAEMYTNENINISIYGSGDNSYYDYYNDGYKPRSTSWTDLVALPYPSDYGYAVGSNHRNECLNQGVRDWTYSYSWVTETDLNNYYYCVANNWFYRMTKGKSYYFLSPRDNYPYGAIYGNFFGGVPCAYDSSLVSVSTSRDVYPVVYLKANVLYAKGNGSETNPYEIK